MAEPNKLRQFELLVHKMDPRSKLLRAWPLTGGGSAQITALEILRSDGRTDKMIVRRHGERDLISSFSWPPISPDPPCGWHETGLNLSTLAGQAVGRMVCRPAGGIRSVIRGTAYLRDPEAGVAVVALSVCKTSKRLAIMARYFTQKRDWSSLKNAVSIREAVHRDGSLSLDGCLCPSTKPRRLFAYFASSRLRSPFGTFCAFLCPESRSSDGNPAQICTEKKILPESSRKRDGQGQIDGNRSIDSII